VQENFAPTWGRYWASTEQDAATAWFYYFPQKQVYLAKKNSNYHRAQAIRAFLNLLSCCAVKTLPKGF
jgi:hypothetical protein